MMRLYRTPQGAVVENEGSHFLLDGVDLDSLLNRESPREELARAIRSLPAVSPPLDLVGDPLPAPIGSQEVWAAGVTYFRSRTARMEESKASGGDSLYDRVYQAERPEIFFKAPAWRVVGHGGEVRIRRDSRWNVPEPELALVVNARGRIVGYSIGNDMSSRDIEGENPLYLPQAKIYDGSCALGPAILLADDPLPPDTAIEMTIRREGAPLFQGETSLARMKRSPDELVSYLYRETTFPQGAVLLTGTGIVPPDTFTLEPGDEVEITIAPIGTLINRVA